MNLNEYQALSAKRQFYPDVHALGGLMYATLGLAGEAGEVANEVKKVKRDDGGEVTVLRRAAIVDELGDVLWYLAAVAGEIGVSLEEVAVRNVDKLMLRSLESGRG